MIVFIINFTSFALINVIIIVIENNNVVDIIKYLCCDFVMFIDDMRKLPFITLVFYNYGYRNWTIKHRVMV